MAESYVQIPPDSSGKRLRSLTHDLGGGDVHTHTTVPVDPATGDAIAVASEDTLAALAAETADARRGITDYRKLIEWDANNLPVYVGLNDQAAATTATDWTIQRITWNSSGLPVDVQVLTGAWVDRAALGWTA